MTVEAQKTVDTIPSLDRTLHAAEARLSGGLSPAALGLAWADWLVHLANQPGRRSQLARQAVRDAMALNATAMGFPVDPITPPPEDHRFAHPGWQTAPYSLAAQSFLRVERFWRDATTDVPGVSRPHERMVGFLARQMLDMMAPPNFPFLNPEVAEANRTQSGANLLHGLDHLLEDIGGTAGSKPETLPLQPGRDVAITPGKVVLRNELIELLQYSPSTEMVHPEPILIVPAWIMKYYILDLSAHNSMIKFLVDQGFTVFCVSWRNPGAAQRDVGLDDYRRLGVMAAIEAVSAICEDAKIHAVGYCLGGTLLSAAAAAMARDHDGRLASLTLLAAQTDFTEAGELQLFISESQLDFLDDIMWSKGFLESSQMAGAFQMLRANDLIWSRLIRRYYLGEADHPNDMMSWNMDATRMPYRMHSEYLRKMFLDNDLAEGRLEAGGRKTSLSDIRLPCYVIGTETDHIAPWRSVYKILLLNDGDVTFVLTSGGHNAGVVSEPGHPHRHFATHHRPAGELYVPPEAFEAAAVRQEGSWWVDWAAWLTAHNGPRGAPPTMGHEASGFGVLGDAPGTYILQR
jgi:polyhydroxyalkanoate synthase